MTEQLGEKVYQGRTSAPQGLKPDTHFDAFAACDPLRGFPEPCPCYKTAVSMSFSPSCEDSAIQPRATSPDVPKSHC